MNYKNILHSLVEFAVRYGKDSPAKRLGLALARLELQAKFLDPLENVPIKGFRLLDPTLSRRGPYDKRWMIQNNRISLQESDGSLKTRQIMDYRDAGGRKARAVTGGWAWLWLQSVQRQPPMNNPQAQSL